MKEWPMECSHIKLWLFKNEEEIFERRKKVYDEAVSAFRQKNPTEEVPTFEESMKVLRYLSYQLNRLCSKKYLRPVITETAGYFFNRFYLNKSIIEYDPRIILFTCMTLAIKAEDYGRKYIFSELFGDMEELDTKLLLDFELTVCDAIQFNLLILHTREPLIYLRNEFFKKIKEQLKLDEKNLGGKNIEEKNIEENVDEKIFAEKISSEIKRIQTILWRNVWAQAEALCHTMQETDIPLLYTPSQMAVSAFLHFAKIQFSQLININQIIQDILDTDLASRESIQKNIDEITERLYKLFKNRNYTSDDEVQAVGRIINILEENVWEKCEDTNNVSTVDKEKKKKKKIKKKKKKEN